MSDEASFRAAWDSNANDTIVLDADIHLSVATCDDADRESVSDPITIDGQGRFKIVQDCAGQRVLFANTNTGNVTFRGVTITGGSGTGISGGGFEESSSNVVTVTIDHSTFSNNSVGPAGSGNDGGGVDMSAASGSTLIVNASSFVNNQVADDGGGIDCDSSGQTITVSGSTFSGNSNGAGRGNSGAAIDLESSNCALSLTNSTVTANTSGDDAAITGESPTSTISIVYSSIVNNATSPATPGAQSTPVAPSTDDPGRVHADGNNTPVATANVEISTPANLTVFGSVIARPHGGPNCSDLTSAPLAGIVSAGYNLADDTSCGLTAATDKQAAGLDPLVGPLANNGGPTQTVLPLTGSPLIDGIAAAACQAGPAAGITVDQRGIARPQGPGCDIGAVEVVAPLVVQPRFTG